MLSGRQCSCKHAQFSLRSTDQQLLQGRLQQHAAVCSRRPRLISNRHEVRAAPDDATPGSSSSSNRRQQQQSSQTAAAESADTDDGLRRKLLAAQQDFQQSLRQLKDSVGIAFIPGYKPTPPAAAAAAAAAANDTGDDPNSNGSSRQDGSKQRYRFSTKQQQQQRRPARFTTYRNLTAVAAAKQREKEEQQRKQQQQLQSIPARLGRILTGRFITERSNSSMSKKNSRQGFNAQTAAVQFELQSQLLDQAQQQQQQQRRRDGSAAAAASGNAFNQVIDILPDGAALPGAEPSPYKAAAAAAAAHFTDPAAAAAEDADANDSAPEAPYPAVTNMLVLVMWAVFVLQWWPLLPELWLTVTRVGLLQAAAAVLLAIPNTAVTQALQLDFAAVQQGSLSGLLTAGLAHSGLAATWICTRALLTCGPFLEFGLGPMALVAIFLVTSLCSSVAHIIAGRSMTAVCGSGAVIGVFTAWTVLANKSLKHQIPARAVNVQLASLVLLNLVVGWLQPAVGIASIVGGLLGGALALLVAGPVAVALQWCLALPVIATLFLLKLMLDAAKGLLNAVLMVVVVISQWTASLVQSVRRV